MPYTYRTISAPRTREAALARITELHRMFVFEAYLLGAVTDAEDGEHAVIIAVTEADEDASDVDTHPTIAAVVSDYIAHYCEPRGLVLVRDLTEVARPSA